MKSGRVVVAVLPALASLILAPGVALAQPPGAVAAGDYRTVANSAGFFSFDPTAFTDLSIIVTDTTTTSVPAGGSPSTSKTTQVQIEFFGNGTGFNGCFNVAPADFTFSPTSATLHTTLTTNSVTCNGPNGGVPLPVTIDATWSANGPTFQNRNGSQLVCGPYSLQTTTAGVNTGANATASMAPALTGTFTGQGNVSSTDTRQHAQGVEPDNCQPFGALAGGAGPPPAGDYQNSFVITDFFVQNPGDFQPSLEVSIFETSQVSTPKVGSPSTTTQFQANIFSNAGGVFSFGCFDITPAQFSNNGVLSAELNTTFTADSPLCFPGSQVTLALPLTVDVVWTGTGPVATTHSDGSLTCLTYRLQSSGLTQTNNENVTATISPLLSSPAIGTGTIQASNSNAHAEGAQQPNCHL